MKVPAIPNVDLAKVTGGNTQSTDFRDAVLSGKKITPPCGLPKP